MISVEEVVFKSAVNASKPILSRVSRALSRRGIGHRDLIDSLDTVNGPHQGTYRPLSLMMSLPHGITQRDIDALVATPEFSTLGRHLIALHLTSRGDTTRVLSSVIKLFLDTVAVDKDVDNEASYSYATQLARHLDSSCKIVAQQIKDVTRDGKEVLEWAYVDVARELERSTNEYLRVLAESQQAQPPRTWIDNYKTRFIELHQDIALPDLTSRRKVHHSDIFIAPSLKLSDDRASFSKTTIPRVQTREVSLEEVLTDVDRIVILGDPGAGKSTISTVQAVQLAALHNRTPFLIRMRELPAGRFNLAQFLVDDLARRYQLILNIATVEKALHERPSVVIFDGLDELLDPSQRRAGTESIESIATAYPALRIIVTSRIVGYSAVALNSSKFAVFQVQHFTREQIVEYAQKWFRVQATWGIEVPSNVVNDFVENVDKLIDLMQNPLLLAFICVLYRGPRSIPRTRAELYKKCALLLLGEWDQAQGVAKLSENIDVFHVALSRVAYLDQQNGSTGLPEDSICEDLNSFLSENVVGSKELAARVVEELISHCRGRAWIFTDEGYPDGRMARFGFTHSSFREYFTAHYLVLTATSVREIVDELYALAVSGRSEVYAQICLNLTDQKSLANASAAIAGILQRLDEDYPPPVYDHLIVTRLLDPGTATARANLARKTCAEYVLRLSDTVPLTREVTKKVLSTVVREMRRGSIDLLIESLDVQYRHHDAVTEVIVAMFEDTVGRVSSLDALCYLWIACNGHYLASLFRGQANVKAIKSLRRYGEQAVARIDRSVPGQNFFATALAVHAGCVTELVDAEQVSDWFVDPGNFLQGVGATSSAEWLIDVFSIVERSLAPTGAACRSLRALAPCLRSLGNAEEFEIPQEHIAALSADMLDPKIESALRRIKGYGIDEQLSLCFISSALVELMEIRGQQHERARRALQKWADSTPADTIPAGLQATITGSMLIWSNPQATS